MTAAGKVDARAVGGTKEAQAAATGNLGIVYEKRGGLAQTEGAMEEKPAPVSGNGTPKRQDDSAMAG